MRFFEFSNIKPIKPMNLAQYAIAAKKRQVDQAKNALRRETDAQKRKNPHFPDANGKIWQFWQYSVAISA